MSAKPELKSVEDEIDDLVAEARPNPETAPDPFNLDNLRLDQSFVESAGVKKLLTTVPVRKPGRQDFIRVHPNQEYRATLAVIELRDEGEIFLVSPGIASELPGEFSTRQIFTAINRQGVVFLWPVRLPEDSLVKEYIRSALDAAAYATKRWVRVKWNRSLGAYETEEAGATLSEPIWPDLPFQELVRIGFRDRLIDNLDHVVIKRLRGLI